MVPPDQVESADRRALLIANHRGAPLAELRTRLAERGWEVAVSRDLATTMELLRQGPDALLVYPLTLQAGAFEWEQIAPRLSPASAVPWLVVGWEEAEPERMTALLEAGDALADWLAEDASPAEIEGRLRNLLRLQKVMEADRALARRLEGQLITDHKTGLYNDRHFRARMQEEFQRSSRHGQPLTVLLLDVDDFKAVNDAFSYETGDRVLRVLGGILRHSVRSIDLPARIGGDEFAVLLPNTVLAEGLAVAVRIKNAARQQEIPEGGKTIRFTVSTGVATFAGRSMEHSREIFLEANEALKAAKRAGKNRVSFHDPRTRSPRLQDQEELQA